MPDQRPSLLDALAVRAALRQAWSDSQPGISGGHEEGGFVIQALSGEAQVVRWPKGASNTIRVPPHPRCKLGNQDIVASFHTHPNTGPDFLQAPSATDKRAVRNDPDLKGIMYIDVLQDDVAVSLARVLAAANKRAREAGVDVRESYITITQEGDDGWLWRVNYGPKAYLGQRGGDVLVEVDGRNFMVTRVLYGQ